MTSVSMGTEPKPGASSTGPEVYIGLITPLGSMTDEVDQTLKDSLRHYHYNAEPIRYSHLLADPESVSSYEDERTDVLIKLGNQLTGKYGNDAVAKLGLRRLRTLRARYWLDTDGDKEGGGRLIPRRAWIFRSLKRPEEVTLLREIYGDAFYALAIQSSYEGRVNRLATGLRATRPSRTEAEAKNKAQRMIERDQDEAELAHGQNVRKTFPMADVVVPGDDPNELQRAVRRFVRLLFRENEVSTSAEHAMNVAEASSALSSSLSRKVGAALLSPDGELLGTGANEVPKAGGGQYGAGEVSGRDEDLGADYSTLSLRHLVAEVMGVLAKEGWLAQGRQQQADSDLDGFSNEAIDLLTARKSQLMDLIEFQRPVHAEMAALLGAGRRGIPTANSHLYTTTYPCHLCAKEIVAAGVSEVIWIEPYPKSRAEAMYGESISGTIGFGTSVDKRTVAFKPFVGVTPRAYQRLFGSGESYRRKDASGRVIQPPLEQIEPRTGNPSPNLNVDQRETSRLQEIPAAIEIEEEQHDG
jgi:deoxycytidylate deaminase